MTARTTVPAILFLASIAAGCSSTPGALQEKAPPVERTFSENYQEIYRRVSGTAKRCVAENVGAYASMAVDADLFPDLGYGEMTISLINWGARNYYASAKFEKLPKGSKMTVHVGNTLDDSYLTRIQHWAEGEQSCRAVW